VSRIFKSATINRSIIWNEVEIGARSVLEECIVTDGVHVAAGTQYQRKILIRAADGTTTVMPLEID
jgi:ADP-glucose pyrophosphorylase